MVHAADVAQPRGPQMETPLSPSSRSGTTDKLRREVSGTSCSVDGTRLPAKCSDCGNLYMPDAVYCRKCGKKRPGAEEEFLANGDSPIVWSWSSQKVMQKGQEFRFMDRNGPFGQSLGIWNLVRIATGDPQDTGAVPNKYDKKEIKKLYLMDIYHSFIDGSTRLQLLVYCAMYLIFWLVFAVIFLLISDRCGLDIQGSFVKAYYLSLETAVTIGYGVPDPYFDGCWEGALVLTVQSLMSYFLNAVVIGAVFVRLTKPQDRANTIVFSDKAVIREIDGAFYFMFQIAEAKHHDLVEAHVRLYCIQHQRRAGQVYSTTPMRLQQPDDEMGGMVLLTLPQRIVHRIDNWSPLSPAHDCLRRQNERNFSPCGKGLTPTSIQRGFSAYGFPEIPQRQVDAEQGNRDTCACVTCGESFQTLELLRRHCEYNAAQDPINGLPEELCHQRLDEQAYKQFGWAQVERPLQHDVYDAQGHPLLVASAEPGREDIENHLAQRFTEVIVLIEGVEPTTSCTLQARHSYMFPSDVVWDADFVECMQMGSANRPSSLNLSKFHEVRPVPYRRRERSYDNCMNGNTSAKTEPTVVTRDPKHCGTGHSSELVLALPADDSPNVSEATGTHVAI
eukprot:TRINITY_DN30909_c0_g1_i1.p1 TRINITY_DN30909_c0_g1~~TRINITY_DN30909_c0_g1_i1.p1  ORF type:complete len:617 (-),score=110.19 TRINITY_DN30909_c0_g1_i1:81-1931(-)